MECLQLPLFVWEHNVMLNKEYILDLVLHHNLIHDVMHYGLTL